MMDIESAMQAIYSTEPGRALMSELEAIRDMPLAMAGPGAEGMTYQRVGQRDLALDLISYMKPKEVENDE